MNGRASMAGSGPSGALEVETRQPNRRTAKELKLAVSDMRSSDSE
jgi:hypothetical protein